VAVPPADDGADALTDRGATSAGADGAAGAHTDGTRAGSPVDERRGSPVRVALLGVLVVALLVSAGVLGWLLWERRGEAEEIQGARERVMAQAEQFMLRMGTFGPDLLEGETMPEYRERVTEVITPTFAEEFREQVVAAEQLVIQQGAERDAEVFSTGVSSIDEDSATALVAGAFTNSVEGQASEPFPFRLRLDLVRTEGEWLVDDFAPITGEEPPAVGPSPAAPPSQQPSGQQTQGQPGGTPPRPSGQPSGGATP
jgi:Mce-associated membrane protein